MERLKFAITLLLLMLCCLGSSAESYVEYDPKLAWLIGKNTAFVSAAEQKRNSEIAEQKKIQDSIAVMTATLVSIKELNMQTLDNADDFQYESWIWKQIAGHTTRIAGASAEICARLWSLKMGAVVVTEITPLTASCTDLVRTFKSIVVNASKSSIKDDKGHDSDGGNYLNRVDRCNMAFQILKQVAAIRAKLESILLQVRFFSFDRMFMKLDPEGWANMWNTIGIVDQIIYSWRHFKVTL